MPRTRPLLLALLVSAAAWLAATGTAQAHTSLTSSSPADGETLSLAPTQVTLAFSGPVRGAEVRVTGPDGSEVTTGPVVTTGSQVTVPVTVTSSGTFLVDWGVTSADGHDLVGTTTFSTDLPVAFPVPDEAVVAPVSPDGGSAASSAPAIATVTAASPEPTSAPVAETGAGVPEDGPNLLVRAVPVVLVLAAGVGGWLLIRRRRRAVRP